jgi:hypothetical protein
MHHYHQPIKEGFMATASVPKDRIAERAYEIFKSRGGKSGRDLDDWLQAEKELARSEMTGSTIPFQTKKNRNTNSNLKFGS